MYTWIVFFTNGKWMYVKAIDQGEAMRRTEKYGIASSVAEVKTNGK